MFMLYQIFTSYQNSEIIWMMNHKWSRNVLSFLFLVSVSLYLMERKRERKITLSFSRGDNRDNLSFTIWIKYLHTDYAINFRQGRHQRRGSYPSGNCTTFKINLEILNAKTPFKFIPLKNPRNFAKIYIKKELCCVLICFEIGMIYIIHDLLVLKSSLYFSVWNLK